MAEESKSRFEIAAEALGYLVLQVQTEPAGQRTWDQLFTRDQRATLGGVFKNAWLDGQAIGMWCRLHGVTGERATVELALALGFADGTTADWLLRELGEAPLARQQPASASVPEWNEPLGQLTFQGKVVRTINRLGQARNIVGVLNAFQEEGWPPRIDDPTPGGADSDRLRRTVATLNTGLDAIKFTADGTGEGIRWGRAELARC